jgi:hypothetical protein
VNTNANGRAFPLVVMLGLGLAGCGTTSPAARPATPIDISPDAQPATAWSVVWTRHEELVLVPLDQTVRLIRPDDRGVSESAE